MTLRAAGAVLLLLSLGAPGSGEEVRIRAASPGEAGPWSRRIDSWAASGQLRRVRLRDDALRGGRRHERFVQEVQGIPVFGSGVTRQRDGGGAVSVFGTVYETPAMDPTPGVSEQAALTIAARLSGQTVGSRRRPLLVFFPATDGRLVLAWRVPVLSPGALDVFFIDARDGQLLDRYDNLQTQEAATAVGTGVLGGRRKLSVSRQGASYVASDALRPPAILTYDLKGDLFRWLSYESGGIELGSSDLAQSTTTTFDDAPSVDAHAYAGWVYDYYYKRHGRRGFDDADAPIVTLVNPVRREDYNRSPQRSFLSEVFLNAFWAEDHLVYGVGVPIPVGGQLWNHLAGSLDVVAHEMTHGVTQYSSHLIYRNESGALNESFSDVMSVSIVFYYDDPSANYEIGDDVITPGGIRSLQAPTRFGDPDHYSVRYTGTGDNGGIHINSGIPNHAFYLAIEGGTNRVSGQTVTGVGAANREQIEKAFYRAFTDVLVPSSNFSDARAATILSARDLYGAGSAAERAVTQAWSAVGVN